MTHPLTSGWGPSLVQIVGELCHTKVMKTQLRCAATFDDEGYVTATDRQPVRGTSAYRLQNEAIRVGRYLSAAVVVGVVTGISSAGIIFVWMPLQIVANLKEFE